jgi:predicted nucleic acid-binding protein
VSNLSEITRLLLDTNAFLYFINNDSALSKKAKSLLESEIDLVIIAASLWEIAIKFSISKLSLPASFVDYYKSMIAAEQINSKLQELPTLYQQEVLHFIEFLSQKAMREGEAETEDKLWTDFSLAQAMRGLEDDDTPEYTEADLKEKWR